MHSRFGRILAVTGFILMGLATLAQAPQTRAEVKMHNGRPVVFVNGQPTALATYSPIGFDPGWYRKQIPRFTPHRLNAYFVYPPSLFGTELFWQGDAITEAPSGPKAAETLKHLDEQAELIIKDDPEAWIIVRFGLFEPDSWRQLHPEEMVVTETGERLAAVPSLASEVYWDAACAWTRAIIRCYEQRPWAARIIGYANFHRMEGCHEAAILGWTFDRSPRMTARWREFLKARYETVEKLRHAYGSQDITFETVEVPKDRLRGPTREVSRILFWQTLADNRPLRDYLELQRDLFHAAFRRVNAAMREGLNGRQAFIVYDALKQTMQGWDIQDFFDPAYPKEYAEPELMAGSGSMEVAKLFETVDFDGLITPHDYQFRGVGGVFEPEGIADSAALRGKLFLAEADVRSYSANQKVPDYGMARNLKEFEAVTWRNWATAFTRGWYAYYMDLCTDWFADPAMGPVLERQVRAWQEALAWPHETVPGIAVIIDDQAVLETNGAGNYASEAVLWQIRQGLARCGVPYRVYLLEDLTLPQFPAHRVFYFPNLFRFTPERRLLLEQRVLRDGNVVVWGPGSGISDGTTVGTGSVKQLTGFDCELIPANFSHRVSIDNFAHALTAGLAADCGYGGPLGYGPLLVPKDGASLGLALTKQGRIYSGLAVKDFGKGPRGAYQGKDALGAGDYASVFTTAVPLPADLWRNLARYAGAHVWCDTNDHVLADRSVVALHSVQSGEKIIQLPKRCTVSDVATGKVIAKRTREVRFALNAPETRVFHLQP